MPHTVHWHATNTQTPTLQPVAVVPELRHMCLAVV